jgi:hypothetical protein
MNRKSVARLGGVIALISVLILPLASCGDVRLRGADILFMETRPGVKSLVVAAAVAAVLAIFIVNRWAQLLIGLIGMAEFIYVAGGLWVDRSPATQVRSGSFLALIGFVMIFLAGLLARREK